MDVTLAKIQTTFDDDAQVEAIVASLRAKVANNQRVKPTHKAKLQMVHT
jgi:hypothetical protein